VCQTNKRLELTAMSFFQTDHSCARMTSLVCTHDVTGGGPKTSPPNPPPANTAGTCLPRRPSQSPTVVFIARFARDFGVLSMPYCFNFHVNVARQELCLVRVRSPKTIVCLASACLHMVDVCCRSGSSGSGGGGDDAHSRGAAVEVTDSTARSLSNKSGLIVR
jgi:hypothetical protein